MHDMNVRLFAREGIPPTGAPMQRGDASREKPHGDPPAFNWLRRPRAAPARGRRALSAREPGQRHGRAAPGEAARRL